MRRTTAFFGFNRGLASRLALARVDMQRLAFSAETMTNWMPRVLGSMMLRPGMAYLGSTKSDGAARFLPFIFSTDDLALIELTNSVMRVWVDDAVISRPSVSTSVANGSFTSNLTSWTDSDEAGGASTWATGGYMQLVGDGEDAAIRDQQVTVAGGDQNTEHALRVVVERGPVVFSVGSTAGADDYVTTTTLETGYHSLAFTPTGDFHIRFLSTLERAVLVDSCTVEASGDMEIPIPYTSSTNLRDVRVDQSGDILFLACKGFLQRKIERRTTRSWSFVWYLSENGPYQAENTTTTTIASSGLTGNVTLTASRDLFLTGHIGCLFSLKSQGQRVSGDISAANTFTNTIEVTGTGEERRFAITLTGTWVATVTLQRSVGVTGNWVDVATYTSNTATTYNDALDNQSVFYRLGVKTGDYTSGTVTATLDYPLGSITGVVRITGVSTSTSATAEVLQDIGSTDATIYWSEGSWSTLSGFPTAVAFYEGRLWWSGNNGVYGSVSDDFYNYNPDTIGDSGPINRTIGSGPVDDIKWMLPLQRLILGSEGAEHSIRATSFDEVLTPSNFNIKEASSYGSVDSTAVRIDSRGAYVQRGGSRVFGLGFDVEYGDYRSDELTLVVPEVGQPSIVHLAVQRLPDTRIHCVRSDGKVAVLIYNPIENVMCWVVVETDGEVEDVVVLPGDDEDRVYYVVKRTIDGNTVRYLEKWALESEARGGEDNKMADSFLTYTGASTTTITGLSHLEGETVTVWGNSKDLGTKVVSGGQITTLPEAVTTAYIGLPYTGQWKSTKLSYVTSQAKASLSMNQPKRIVQVGFVLADAYYQAIQFGPSFDFLDDMPGVEDGADVSQTQLDTAYDHQLIEFPGEWESDSRLCLQAVAPRPVTVLAAVLSYEASDKA